LVFFFLKKRKCNLKKPKNRLWHVPLKAKLYLYYNKRKLTYHYAPIKYVMPNISHKKNISPPISCLLSLFSKGKIIFTLLYPYSWWTLKNHVY
jgi:hypothetical protein